MKIQNYKINGLIINKNKSKILSIWDSSKRFKKIKINLVMMILVLRTKTQNLKKVKKALKVEMMIFLEIKVLQLSLKRNKPNKQTIKNLQT
jgi:hypothetical protein